MNTIKINGRNFELIPCCKCGKEVPRRKTSRRYNTFCSRECESEFKKKKEIRKCFKCGKSFERTLADLRRSKSGNTSTATCCG